MASTYKIPGQNVEIAIPDIGQVYRSAGSADQGGATIFTRQGDQLFELNLADLGRQTYGASAFDQQGGQYYGVRSGAEIAGAKALKDLYGIDYDTLGVGNFNDISLAQNIKGGGKLTPDMLKGFLGKGTTPESVTQGVSTTNPNAPTLNSSVSGNIAVNAPTYGSTGAINPGVLSSYRNPNVDLQKVNPIPFDALGGTTPSKINLPTGPATTGSAAGTLAGVLAGVGGAAGGGTGGGNTTGAGGTTDLTSLFQQYLNSSTPPPSQSAAYQAALNESGVTQKQQLVNDLTAQLNSEVAKARAAQLIVEQQAGGKDVTGTYLGRQQQEIERQAAINILPIQAQLQAAQGNLQFAQQQLETVFRLKSEDAKAQYDYQKSLRDAVYNFATEQQKIQLAAKQKEDDRAFQLTLKNLDNANEIAKEIMKTDPKTAAAITRLDPSSPTFTNDLARLQASAVAATVSPADINANLNAWASDYAQTGKIPSNAELKTAGVTYAQVQQRAKELPKPTGALVSTNTGVTPTNINNDQKAGIEGLRKNVQTLLPRLKELFGKLDTGPIDALGARISPSNERREYITGREEFINNLLFDRSGATVTPAEREIYENLLPTDFDFESFGNNSAKFDALAKQLTTKLDGLLASNQLSIYGYSQVEIPVVDPATGKNKIVPVGSIVEVGPNKVKVRVLPDGTYSDTL